jgi:hypothetical protein
VPKGRVLLQWIVDDILLARISPGDIPHGGSPILQSSSLFNRLLQHFPRAEFGARVHPDRDAAIQEAGTTGAAFATEAKLSEATASWPTSRMVQIWNGFAGAPPFADLTEIKKFKDRKSAVTRIWNAAQRLGEALEEEMKIAEQDVLRAQQEMLGVTKATKPAKGARTAAPKAPAKPEATKDATSTDDAPAPKQREGTRKATVIALLERAGGATLEEIMSATAWQEHSVRGFISTLGSKHGYNVVSTRRETDKARCYSSTK